MQHTLTQHTEHRTHSAGVGSQRRWAPEHLFGVNPDEDDLDKGRAGRRAGRARARTACYGECSGRHMEKPSRRKWIQHRRLTGSNWEGEWREEAGWSRASFQVGQHQNRRREALEPNPQPAAPCPCSIHASAPTWAVRGSTVANGWRKPVGRNGHSDLDLEHLVLSTCRRSSNHHFRSIRLQIFLSVLRTPDRLSEVVFCCYHGCSDAPAHLLAKTPRSLIISPKTCLPELGYPST